MFEKGLEEVNARPRVTKKERNKKIARIVGYMVVCIMLIASILFHFMIVQPAILQAMVSQSNKQMSEQLYAYRQSTNDVLNVITQFDTYATEYQRQECGVPVAYDVKQYTGLIESAQNHLKSEYKMNQNYGVLYSEQLQVQANTVLIASLQPRQKILNIVETYKEVPDFTNFLTDIRNECARLTSLDTNKQQVLGSFCSNFGQVFLAWSEPSTAWLQGVWNKTRSFQANCSQQKTFDKLLDAYIKYTNSLFENIPDKIQLRTDLEANYEAFQRSVTEAQQANLNYVTEKQKFANQWYLLSIKL